MVAKIGSFFVSQGSVSMLDDRIYGQQAFLVHLMNKIINLTTQKLLQFVT